VAYPSEAERRRLERFPDRIAVEDLRACFALSDDDRRLRPEQQHLAPSPAATVARGLPTLRVN
jgi:hypothetical protein